MARSKKEEAEWQEHRDELKALWLDQRWTLEKIQEYMSQRHNFRKSAPQYTRQFKRWGFKENLTDEDWKFVARLREKRKRDGKEPGDVRVHGNLIPESKVNKGNSSSCFIIVAVFVDGRLRPYAHPSIVSDPKTPEGVVVGTPRLEIDGTGSDDSANIHAMDCSQILSVNGMNAGTSTMSQSADKDPLAFQIELPDLSYSEFSSKGNGEPTATPSCLGDATLEHRRPVLTSASTPISTKPSTHVQYDVDSFSKVIAHKTRLAVRWQIHTCRPLNPNDPFSNVKLIRVGMFISYLVSRAEAIFHSSSPVNLSHYLGIWVDLSSSNLMDQWSTDDLVLLIKKWRSQSLLVTHFKSTATAIEIFMSDLLTSAAAVGDIEICRILIEAGTDLDATRPHMRATALHRAVKNNYAECARMLLEAGADPNSAVDGDSATHRML